MSKDATIPLIQWHTCGNDTRAGARDNATTQNHGKGTGAPCAGLQPLAHAHDSHANEGGIATSQPIRSRVGEKDVAQPCADVINGSDEPVLGRVEAAQRHLEAGMDQN